MKNRLFSFLLRRVKPLNEVQKIKIKQILKSFCFFVCVYELKELSLL